MCACMCVCACHLHGKNTQSLDCENHEMNFRFNEMSKYYSCILPLLKWKNQKKILADILFNSLYFLAFAPTFIENRELSHIVNTPYQIVYVDTKELLVRTVVCLVVLNGTESIRTQVNSYLSQFVLILVNSYSVFGQFVLIL